MGYLYMSACYYTKNMSAVLKKKNHYQSYCFCDDLVYQNHIYKYILLKLNAKWVCNYRFLN